MTVPMGVIFGKVYEIWNLTGLSGGKAMETALLIALVIAGIYALYFVMIYRIACGHVLCCGGENDGREFVFPKNGAAVDFAGRGTRPHTITEERRTEASL